MANTPQLNIRVPVELKEAFIQKAKEDGTTATDLIVGFMQQYLGIEPKKPITRLASAEIDSRLSELEERLAARIAVLETTAGKVSEGGLNEEVERLRTELAECEAAKNDFFDDCARYIKRIKELEGKLLTHSQRDRILAALGVGKQSPTYKRVKAVLDQFVNEVQGDGQKEKDFENLEL